MVRGRVSLTFDPQVELVTDGLALRVRRRTRVSSAAILGHSLQHQALVAPDYPRRYVVVEEDPLQKRNTISVNTKGCRSRESLSTCKYYN